MSASGNCACNISFFMLTLWNWSNLHDCQIGFSSVSSSVILDVPIGSLIPFLFWEVQGNATNIRAAVGVGTEFLDLLRLNRQELTFYLCSTCTQTLHRIIYIQTNGNMDRVYIYASRRHLLPDDHCWSITPILYHPSPKMINLTDNRKGISRPLTGHEPQL